VTDEKTAAAEDRKRIGELLLDAGVITQEQLDEALEEKKTRGGRLCFNLIRTGALKSDDLLAFLSEQFGVAAVNLDHFQVAPEVLGRVPEEYARSETVVPLLLFDETLTVAMLDPGRGEVVDELERVTGLSIDPLIAPEASLVKALEKYYPAPGGTDTGAGEGVLVLGEEKEAKHIYLASPPSEGYATEDWLKRFFLQSIRRRSREIHLEPSELGLRARFRADGRMIEGETAPVDVRKGLVNLALTLARIDSRSSALSPMEGRMKVIIRKRALPVTLSSFPTIHGERLVFKIMDEALVGRGFQELGMSKTVADETRRILGMTNGILLVNGPPGHGKRTTFYSILDHLRGEAGRNVMTLEHPVQYPVPGISQTQVSFGQGLDFYHGLKSLMRQSPDVVGLSDISDCRTLELVFTAARECLVVGLCGFRDSREALEWVGSCRVNPNAQADLVRGMLVQRVVPRICSQCREKLDAPEDLVEGLRDKSPEDLTFYSGVGCKACGQTGRAGWLGLYELLAVNFFVRDLIERKTETQIIYDEALRQGMWSLQEDGIMKATQGLVDIRDVLEATRDRGLDG
jgi:type IV pilus assembly protein PilB